MLTAFPLHTPLLKFGLVAILELLGCADAEEEREKEKLHCRRTHTSSFKETISYLSN